ncbi:MAG TPA: hypothetical protein VIG64_01870 [Actinomycetota bacterium]
MRGRTRLLTLCWPVALTFFAPGGCIFAACNDVPCPSQVLATFDGNLVAGASDVTARMCFDGTCSTLRGVISKKRSLIHSGPVLLELVQGRLELTLDLGDATFDTSVPHEMVAELEVEGAEPVVLRREDELVGEEKQGTGCGFCYEERLSVPRDLSDAR